MHREHFLEQLERYGAKWKSEGPTIERFIRFVVSNEDCFERTLKIGHVTGSAWVVNEAGTHVLLTHHKRLGRWLQLGGHADGEHDVRNVALREAKEESGISHLEPIGDEIFDVDIHLIPGREDEPEHYHYDVRYAFTVKGDTTFSVSDESHELCWVEIETLSEYSTEESMARMARKWR